MEVIVFGVLNSLFTIFVYIIRCSPWWYKIRSSILHKFASTFQRWRNSLPTIFNHGDSNGSELNDAITPQDSSTYEGQRRYFIASSEKKNTQQPLFFGKNRSSTVIITKHSGHILDPTLDGSQLMFPTKCHRTNLLETGNRLPSRRSSGGDVSWGSVKSSTSVGTLHEPFTEGYQDIRNEKLVGGKSTSVGTSNIPRSFCK